MVSVDEIKNFSKKSLVEIYQVLNHWGWHVLLGEKPEGWDKMPNYKKPYMGECKTKEDIIRPYMKAIRKVVPYWEL